MANKTAVFGTPGSGFRKLAEKTDSSPRALAVGVRLREMDNGLAEKYGIDYAVILNEGAIGKGVGQIPEEDVPLGVLHEIVERGIVKTYSGAEQVSVAVGNLSERAVSANGVSERTKNRFSPKHLQALGSEYVAVFTQANGGHRDKMLAMGSFHQRTIVAMRARDGGVSADNLARTFTLRELCKSGIFQDEEKI